MLFNIAPCAQSVPLQFRRRQADETGQVVQQESAAVLGRRNLGLLSE